MGRHNVNTLIGLFFPNYWSNLLWYWFFFWCPVCRQQQWSEATVWLVTRASRIYVSFFCHRFNCFAIHRQRQQYGAWRKVGLCPIRIFVSSSESTCFSENSLWRNNWSSWTAASTGGKFDSFLFVLFFFINFSFIYIYYLARGDQRKGEIDSKRKWTTQSEREKGKNFL